MKIMQIQIFGFTVSDYFAGFLGLDSDPEFKKPIGQRSLGNNPGDCGYADWSLGLMLKIWWQNFFEK